MANSLRKDPAIEQFNHMRANTSKYFKINRTSGSFLLVVIGLLPIGLGYLSYKTHGQLELAGIRRGQSPWRDWPESMKPKQQGAARPE